MGVSWGTGDGIGGTDNGYGVGVGAGVGPGVGDAFVGDGPDPTFDAQNVGIPTG
jgi:hypothetical protein